MKAVEFVKQVGWVKASEELKRLKHERIIGCFFNDLKTLVEAKELVDLYGGLLDAKKCLLLAPYAIDEDGSVDMLRKAIKLVESVENA